MIIDSFIYYNEVDVVDIRINELKDVVDKVVVLSATTTFRGNPNTYEFPKHLHDVADIDVHRLDFPAGLEKWDAERWLRNQLNSKLRQFSRNDMVIFSDADEIARPSVVQNIDSKTRLEIDQYYYNFNTYMRHHACMFVSKVGDLTNSVYDMRFYDPMPIIEAGGWEFSFFGDSQFIRNKLVNYSHSELEVDEYINLDKIQHRMDNGIDIVDRPIEGEPKGPLPRYVTNNREKFIKYWRKL